MKRNLKKIVKRIVFVAIVFTLFVGFNYTFAKLGEGFNTSYMPHKVTIGGKFETAINDVVSTITAVMGVLGTAGIAITGVKYMYADSQSKAKIKQTLIWLVIGTILIFSAPAVIKVVEGFGKDILKGF